MKRRHNVRLENLIVLRGALYRMKANAMWVKYDSVEPDLHAVDVGAEIKVYSGVTYLKGPHHTFAFFPVREMVEGGFIERVVRLEGAATHKFKVLVDKFDVRFITDQTAALEYVNRATGQVEGRSPLAYMLRKETT